jgi:FkbM family methyltransferase
MNPAKKFVQTTLLGLYRAVGGNRLLATPFGRTCFEAAYGAYKLTIEAGAIGHLAPLIRPDTLVIDVGANVGFFTRRFAKWISGSGSVIAIEPEDANFARLAAMIEKAGLGARVEPVRAAAAEHGDGAMLALNPDNPADHKLAAAGIPVATVTLDELVAKRGWPDVSLIKIDVQGGEMRVIAGAGETLRRCRPALFVEVDDANLRAAGSSAERLADHLAAQGYTLHRLARAGVSAPLSRSNLGRILSEAGGYMDVLFLPPPKQ